MSDWASTYGKSWADVYDTIRGAPGPTVIDVLEKLAAGGRALELGIGTGRVALPLAARGVEVHGIDNSVEMVARMRAKPGGDAIPVTIGDFGDVPAEGEFQLIFAVFNTLFSLITEEAQIRCFERAVGHLTRDGGFLIEAFVPNLDRINRGQGLHVSHVGDDDLTLVATQYDLPEQQIRSQHVIIDSTGIRLLPIHLRYVLPEQLDSMAQATGLQLRERWSNWSGEEFNAGSTKHVSIYERA